MLHVTELFLIFQDCGRSWNRVHAGNSTGGLGGCHIKVGASKRETSMKILYKDFYDVCGIPRMAAEFLGTFEGISRSDDTGRSWKFVETISGWIRGLSVERA